MTGTTSIFATNDRETDVFTRAAELPLMPTAKGTRTVMGPAATLQSAVGSTVVAASLMLFSSGDYVGASRPEITNSVVTIEATSRPGVPAWWSGVQAKLAEYQSMPPGWLPSAQPISANAVGALLSFLEAAASARTPVPAVVPLEDGGVQAEWHASGVDIEVSASTDGQVITYVASGEGEEIEEAVSPESELDGWIDQLLIPTHA